MTPKEEIDLRGCRVLDGGFATELERRGVSLAGPLWSARALAEAPDAVIAVHRDYLDAGADCLLTASYQASALGYAEAIARLEGVAGFEAGGWAESPGDETASMPEAAVEWSAEARIFAIAKASTRSALLASVRLAVDARNGWHADGNARRVLIAASLGPYGAALHNGAEFHGNYGDLSFADLVTFHRERIAILAETEADLLAFETVPSLVEAEAIVAALADFPEIAAWVCFTCRDATHVAHGEPLEACARFLDRAPQVVAMGINCTAPGLILPLLRALRAGSTKPAIVYPNSGEEWDAVAKRWLTTPHAGLADYGELAAAWFHAGAAVVGGCCRTGPAHIEAVRMAAEALPV